MISDYNLTAWLAPPTCTSCKKKPAVKQRIDQSKLGTSEFSSYLCQDCLNVNDNRE